MKVFKRGPSWGIEYQQDGRRVRKSLGSEIKTEKEALAWLAEFEKKERALELRQAINDYVESLEAETACYEAQLAAAKGWAAE